MSEKAYEKHAWILFFAIGVLMLAAVPHVLGVNTDPGQPERIIGMTLSQFEASNPRFFDLYSFYFRGGGLSDLGFGFLIIAISVTAYRRGEKWAWYAFWSVPAFFAVFTALVSSTGAPPSEFLFPAFFAILSLLGLLLPYRKFFPSK